MRVTRGASQLGHPQYSLSLGPRGFWLLLKIAPFHLELEGREAQLSDLTPVCKFTHIRTVQRPVGKDRLQRALLRGHVRPGVLSPAP